MGTYNLFLCCIVGWIIWVIGILKVEASGWAKILSPNESFQKKKGLRLIEKKLKHEDKIIRVILNSNQYLSTHKEELDHIKWGYSNLNKTGTYHCVVCDQLLFSSEDKVSDYNNLMRYPTFVKTLGKIDIRVQSITEEDLGKYSKEYYPKEDENITTYDAYWDNWDSYLGMYNDYNGIVESPTFELNSSSMCFNPDSSVAKTEKEREELLKYGGRYNNDVEYYEEDEDYKKTDEEFGKKYNDKNIK
jgi:hypothetical protein